MKTRIRILGAHVKAGQAWQPPGIPELWREKRHRVGMLASWTSQNCQTVVLLREPTSVTKAKSGWGEYLLTSTLISTCTHTDVYMRLYRNVWAQACKHTSISYTHICTPIKDGFFFYVLGRASKIRLTLCPQSLGWQNFPHSSSWGSILLIKEITTCKILPL